ncbi:MAG: hypothetical protein QM778_34100 [Myxococcales bacterium]
MRPWLLASLVCSAVVGSVAACGDDAGPTAACGEETKTYDCASSTVSYHNTVEPLATAYCIDCHSSTKTGDARMSAPVGHDYDTEDGWRATGGHALIEIECGRMPYMRDPVPQEMVDKLDEWITCQGLKGDHDHGADEQ